MTRRSFIKYIFLGTALTVSANASDYKWSESLNTEKLLYNMIKSVLSFLPIETSGLQQFSTDYASNEKLDIKHKIALILLTYLPDNLYPIKLQNYQKKIVERYLLSTTFFLTDTQSPSIKYVSYYDPLGNPCQNPFATLRNI